MAFDYFTIQALAEEMRSHLLGAVIERAYSQANELAFAIAGGEDYFYGMGGRAGVMCLRSAAWPRDWSTGNGPEKYLVRARIVDVVAEREERIIRLKFERQDRRGQASYGVLVCQLIPNKVQFFLHREEGDEILGHWGELKAATRIGQRYRDPDSAGRLLPGRDPISAWNEQLATVDESLEKNGRRWLCGADIYVIRELLFRATQQGGEQSATGVWNAAVAAYGASPIAKSYLWEEGGKTIYSALEPSRLQGDYECCEGVSWTIWQVRERDREQRKSQGENQKIKSRLSQALKNGRRRLSAMQLELEEAATADDCEKKGNTLLANLSQLSGGASQVQLADVFDPEGATTLHIEMDPNRSPAENAARYLKSVKKYRRRQQIVPPRLNALASQCQKWAQWICEVDKGSGQEDEELQDWLEANVKNVDKQTKASASAHPRRYRTSTGWSVWAGRNNKENDILTHKMSAQNDMWFHAHGYPGSHVVLRREGRKEEPDKLTLEEAAGVAAFWSKGKTAKKVSVVYTLIKYVTKPRGGAPGQAILRREKTVVVGPALISEDHNDT